MEIRTFDIPDETDKIEDLLNDENYDVKKILTFGRDNYSLLLIYKTKEEQQTLETKRLEQIKDVTKSVRDDQVYSKLKNVNQRCLYLLERYKIPKSIALDVIDEELVQKFAELSSET